MGRTHILKGFSDIDAALWALSQTNGASVAELVEVAQAAGLRVLDSTRFEALQVLAELGLACRDPRSLSEDGRYFYRIWQVRRTDAVDLLHGLQYGLWTSSQPDENVSSWAYRTVCDYLWDRQVLPQSSDELVRYVHSQRSAMESIPPDLGNAFSNKSILDAYDWLLPLEPAVLYGVSESGNGRSFRQATFQRRGYCSTPLFLMAIDYLFREQRQEYGDLITIDGDNLQTICSFCMIEEPAIEIMLDDALRRFPSLLSFQREWGMYVSLSRKPRMSDFV